MRTSEAFPSNYLKADDLQGRQVPVVIESYAMEDIGDDHKPVLRFVGKSKSVVLNKTNATTIAEGYGEEMDNWIGKKLILYPTKTFYAGKQVPCLRIMLPANAPTGTAPAASAAAKPSELFEPPSDDDSNIPF